MIKLVSLDPSGTIFSVIGPIVGLVSLGITVQSKRNQVQHKNEIAERSIKQNLKKIRNHMRDAGENFEEISELIKNVAIKYNNNFLEENYRGGVHLILDHDEAKAYVHAKKEMDGALCQAMILINGSLDLVLNSNPKSALILIDLADVLQRQINDLFSMNKTYEVVINDTLALLEIVNQRLSEMGGNRF